MKWVADENLKPEYVDWLIARGDDVLSASEVRPRAGDPTWLELGLQQGRIVITEDLDFGTLVFRDKLPTVGVVQLRLYQTELPLRLAALKPHMPLIERHCFGNFITVTERKLRIRPIE